MVAHAVDSEREHAVGAMICSLIAYLSQTSFQHRRAAIVIQQHRGRVASRP